VPTTDSRPSARELLGGRWAISLRGWLIVSALVLVIGANSRSQLDVPAPTIAVVALAGWVLMSVLYLAAHLTVFRNRRTAPVHVAWLVALGVLVGLARAAAALAVPESRAVLGDGWMGAATATLWIVPVSVLMVLVVTYLIAVFDWYAVERTRLLRFEIDAEAARLRAVGALNAARGVITTRIQSALEDQLNGLERAATAGDTDDRLSDALLDTAAGYVRPESHRLWQERDPALRRGGIIDLERASLAAPLPIALPYALWAVVVIPASVLHFGLRWLPSALALLVAMAVLYPLGTAAVHRYTPAPRYVGARLIALVVMAAAAAAYVGTAAVGGLQAASPLQQVLPGVFIILMTILVSWAQAAIRIEDARLSSLRSLAESAEFERLALEAATDEMQRELALYLHGTVQAGLVASAYSIQDAVNRGDTVALESAIADARASIARVGQDTGHTAAHDLVALRATINERWDGAIAINWHLPATEPEPAIVTRIDNVLQECLANATIHGAATEATVRIVVEDDDVIVEVTDDGTGVGGGKPGLGSAILNEATGGQWSIASVPSGGAQVRAVVPS
jgi:signal transduction histidine kinase